jgi:VWFA-related protein
MRCGLIFLASIHTLSVFAAAQTAAAIAQTQASVAGGAGEVVLDLVVHDRHSRPVRDLRPEEVRVTDGGIPVKIARLTLEGQQASAEPRLVSFIFDGLDSYASPTVRKAADEMLNSLAGTGALFSVWRISDRLELMQTFTKDGALLDRAIEAATAPPQNPAAGQAGAAQQGGDELTLNAQRTIGRWERIYRDERLRPPVSGLVALARQQAALKGRKAIVYFSDGVQVETCPPDQLRTAIGSASRAGVVIYAVNIGGLSEAVEKKASSILESSAPASDGQPGLGAPAAKAGSDPPKFTFIQLDMDASQRIPLEDLAESTGGIYVRRAGDMGAAVGTIADDLTTYYELAYASPVQDRDGQFRMVSVRVNRPQTRVQFPDGYFALPAEAGPDVVPFEVPMLKALSSPQKTETIPFRIDTLHLGDVGGKARGEVVLELPLQGILCKADTASGLCDMHFSVLALIKDAGGKVLEKFSQDVPDQMAGEGLRSASGSAYTFQRPFALPPGEYRLEAAVVDRLANKVSSKATSFSLSVTPGLSVCDVFLVRTLEPAESRSDTDDPLRYEDGRVVPLLIPLWTGADRDVRAFLIVSTDSRVSAPARVVLQVERDKHMIERPAIKVLDHRQGLPIPVTASLKRSLLEPGHYQLVVKLTQGKESMERRLNFEVLTKPAPVVAEQTMDEAVKSQGSGVAALLDVKLIAGAPKPDDAELKRIIAAARERAADYREALPNFVCTRTTTKFSRRRERDDWTPVVANTDLLQYADGAEKAQTLASKEVANVPTLMKKLQLVGELGGMLSLVFNQAHAAQIEWQGMAEIKGVRVHVFRYQVTRSNSGYLLSLGDRGSQVLAAYRGSVLIDANTMAIKRVTVEAVDLPKNFPIQQSAIAVDYDYVQIAGKRYLVPQHATWLYEGANSRQLARYERVFQNYRKYTTTSGIKYMGEAKP